MRGPGGLTGLPVTRQAAITAGETDTRTIYWRVAVRGDHQELDIEVAAAHPLDAGKALELWALAGAHKIAVSLEPAGGSPTGRPTGPVLHLAGLRPA